MRQRLQKWQFIGFVFVSVAGTFLHFLYDMSGQKSWAALFSGVNESTWEHMKLLYVPLFIFAVCESFIFPELENFWCVKLAGALVGLMLIPVLFYTYNGAFGISPSFVNISIFYISAAAAFALEYRLFSRLDCKGSSLSFIILFAILLLFVIFTFYPPRLPIFEDPTIKAALSGGFFKVYLSSLRK